MATCKYCGAFFNNPYQLGPHTRICRHVAVVSNPPESPDLLPESPGHPDLADSPDAPPVIREPAFTPVFPPINNTPVDILALARRPRGSNWGVCEQYPLVPGLQHVPGPDTKDYSEVRL